MQKQSILKTVFLLLLFTCVSFSIKAQIVISDAEMPNNLSYSESDSLPIYGVGVRKFLWLDLYAGAIFLNNTNLKPKEIVEVNQPMALRLHVISRLVSKKRIIKAIKDGFDKSTEGNLKHYQKRIDQMIAMFDADDIQPGDTIDLVYSSNGKTDIYKNQQYLGSIKGLDFKQALFGVWISKNAADASFKEQLLEGI